MIFNSLWYFCWYTFNGSNRIVKNCTLRRIPDLVEGCSDKCSARHSWVSSKMESTCYLKPGKALRYQCFFITVIFKNIPYLIWRLLEMYVQHQWTTRTTPGSREALGYFLGGYVPPGTPNWHPFLKKLPLKLIPRSRNGAIFYSPF